MESVNDRLTFINILLKEVKDYDEKLLNEENSNYRLLYIVQMAEKLYKVMEEVVKTIYEKYKGEFFEDLARCVGSNADKPQWRNETYPCVISMVCKGIIRKSSGNDEERRFCEELSKLWKTCNEQLHRCYFHVVPFDWIHDEQCYFYPSSNNIGKALKDVRNEFTRIINFLERYESKIK